MHILFPNFPLEPHQPDPDRVFRGGMPTTLGMRLVKRSVNQDDVSAYHLFYADGLASPGSDLPFFDWPVDRERRGGNSVTRTTWFGQIDTLENQYAAKWGIYPASVKAQNRVIWDRNEWKQTDGRLVDIPYFGGKDTGMPLVQLTGTAGGPSAGQVIWVWSIHNPADTQGNAAGHRKEALRRQLATMTELSGTGIPAVILFGVVAITLGKARAAARSRSHCAARSRAMSLRTGA